jgi:hypothetical protein
MLPLPALQCAGLLHCHFDFAWPNGHGLDRGIKPTNIPEEIGLSTDYESNSYQAKTTTLLAVLLMQLGRIIPVSPPLF